MKNVLINLIFLSLIAGTFYLHVNFDHIYSFSKLKVGDVVNLNGEVNARHEDELVDTELKSNDLITNNTIIQTYENSNTEIKLTTGETIKVLENTLILIRIAKNKDFEFNILNGEVKTTKKKNSRIRINNVKSLSNFKFRRKTKTDKTFAKTKPKQQISSTSPKKQTQPQKTAPKVEPLRLLNELVTSKPISSFTKPTVPALTPKKISTPKPVKLELTSGIKKPKRTQLPKPKPSPSRNTPKRTIAKKPPLKIKTPSLGSKTSVSLSQYQVKTKVLSQLPRDKVWLKEASPINIGISIESSKPIKVFYYANNKDGQKIYFKNPRKKMYATKIDFSKITPSLLGKKQKDGFSSLIVKIFAENPTNKNQVSFIHNFNLSYRMISDFGFSKIKVDYIHKSKNRKQSFKEHTSKGKIASIYLSDLSQISVLWNFISKIKKISKIRKMPFSKRKNAILIERDQVAMFSKNIKVISEINRKSSSNYAGYIGAPQDYLGYLGTYEEALKKLKSKKLLTKNKMLYFLYEKNLVPISVELLQKDRSAYNLLNNNYDVVFTKKVKLLEK